jgi:hypothetical protein
MRKPQQRALAHGDETPLAVVDRISINFAGSSGS